MMNILSTNATKDSLVWWFSLWSHLIDESSMQASACLVYKVTVPFIHTVSYGAKSRAVNGLAIAHHHCKSGTRTSVRIFLAIVRFNLQKYDEDRVQSRKNLVRIWSNGMGISAATCIPIECAFGILKNLFAAHKLGLKFSNEDDTALYMFSLLILYNIFISYGGNIKDFLDEYQEEEEEDSSMFEERSAENRLVPRFCTSSAHSSTIVIQK